MRIEAYILYDKDDMRKLHHMTTRECINALEEIDRGTLPNNYVMLEEIMDDDNKDKEYSSDQYAATKYHVAVRQAITALRDINKAEASIKSVNEKN